MQPLDLVVIVAYLAASAWLGLRLSGKQRNTRDYFLGNRQLPWWAVCLSVVATETSALTVISVPAIAYGGDITYLQLAIGYLIGRTVVAFVLLPRYYRGEMTTAYAYLGQRFGRGMQSTAGVTFLFTRVLGDGVRMFAAAIPMKVILDSYGLELNFFLIIAILGAVTIVYSLIGGIRAVVWTDVLQMGLYVAGGIMALAFIVANTDTNFLATAAEAGKTKVVDFTSNPFTTEYASITAVVGGALLSTASHGADQIIVQRLLGCRSQRDAQKAIIASAVIVFVQFALFLLVGLALFSYFDGASAKELGLSTPDDVFPHYIVEGLPAGLSGLLLAGIMASAMSTLSSSLSALSSSTMADLYEKFSNRTLTDAQGLKLGRIFTLSWGLLFILAGALFMFVRSDQRIVELALQVTSVTYGGLLGAFFLGLWVRRARQLDTILAFGLATAVLVGLFVAAVFFNVVLVVYTWYTAIGVLIVLVVGSLLSLRNPTVATGDVTDDGTDTPTTDRRA